MPAPTRFWEAKPGRTFVGRLATGSDLVEEIERTCADRGISAGEVTVVGAVRTAAYAFYEQSQQRYVELASSDHHELAGFVGNISLRDGKPFLHAHCTLADEAGGTVSGHLLRGTEVFVAEVNITEWTDVSLVRAHDETTGLALW
jgi:predicted DNA-binding protein with PD1-like motif